MIQYLRIINPLLEIEEILKELSNILEGTWACIIFDSTDPTKLYFMKNENPLLLGLNDNIGMFTSEPSGFMNMVDNYILLREKTYGWVSNIKDTNEYKIYGEYKELPLIKSIENG